MYHRLPDTALPNTAQDISTILERAAHSYVSSPEDRVASKPSPRSTSVHAPLWWKRPHRRKKKPFLQIVRAQVSELEGISDQAKEEFCGIIDQLPMAYGDVTAIFRAVEKKSPGNGGSFPSSSQICARDAVSVFKSVEITTLCA